MKYLFLLLTFVIAGSHYPIYGMEHKGNLDKRIMNFFSRHNNYANSQETQFRKKQLNNYDDKELIKAISNSDADRFEKILKTYKEMPDARDLNEKIHNIHRKILYHKGYLRTPDWYNPFVLPITFWGISTLSVFILTSDSVPEDIKESTRKITLCSLGFFVLTTVVLARELLCNTPVGSLSRTTAQSNLYDNKTKKLYNIVKKLTK